MLKVYSEEPYFHNPRASVGSVGTGGRERQGKQRRRKVVNGRKREKDNEKRNWEYIETGNTRQPK